MQLTPTYCIGSSIAAVDINGTDDRVWMDRNLGATRVPTSSTDNTEGFGGLYQ
ncbi:MAG: hypothetical protein GKR88_11865 [Flavobacteriaceae bacterium]|nr:MAG: hypothetical protein GKR88_11865 [Flavobacteriaceae bacterium]